ncbi:MAG: hypothetical protein M1434_15645, partial [Chloroflexi bacterium]|nr:hypothetical protein [Chloroflexota bacterium]
MNALPARFVPASLWFRTTGFQLVSSVPACGFEPRAMSRHRHPCGNPASGTRYAQTGQGRLYEPPDESGVWHEQI